MGVTAWVRRALAELGPETPDQEVRAYIREKDPTVPLGQVSLALRKVRGHVRPPLRKKPEPHSESQGSLFPFEHN
jgi:hypothetical protein